MNATSALRALLRAPRQFEFDAVVRLLQHAARSVEPGVVARFRSSPHLGYPGADVLSVQEGTPPVVVTSVIGLAGATGVLPRGYTEQVSTATRERSPSLHAFIDMIADRFVAHFAAAGAKYRLHRAAENARLGGAADQVENVLLALSGYATSGLVDRLDCGTAPLMHYAGFFAARPRSADRLAALASDWLGRRVEVVQFVGGWLAIPPDQRTRLAQGFVAGSFCTLGVDAAVGVRAWDVQGRILLRVGPLQRCSFERLLPDGEVLGKFVALVRAYLGFETGFAVNLVVARESVPPLQFRDEGTFRLGWNSWLGGRQERDAAEPMFEAELVEAETARRRAAVS